ncbi:MAG: DUF6880 family protein [Armatimonadota bacterium]
MKSNNIRELLIGLGPCELADAILRLASRDDEADRVVRRMVSIPSEKVKAFKSKLAALKRTRRFIDWRGASSFAHELDQMLDDLEAGCDDPEVGLEQVIAFFEADEQIFEQCDDSGGYVGTVFQCSACDLFVRYASDYSDKAHLIDRLMKLYESDEYGVRVELIRSTHRFLSKKMLRVLADRIRQKIREQPYSYHWSNPLASIARYLKDAPMYEEALRAACPQLSLRQYPDIAQAYLETGDAKTALSWMERAGEYGHSDLMLRIHTGLGNIEKAKETAWQIFHEYRSQDNLTKLLSVIGEDRREQVVADEVRSILSLDSYYDFNATFLIDIGRMDEAECYLLNHSDKLDGGYYTGLLPMAESMEKDGRYLAATVVYRALLDSILARGVSKYYHHGVRYLTKLDSLDGSIDDWKDFSDHGAYKVLLREAHGRKTAFWSQYGK